jgi:hypothetical protein
MITLGRIDIHYAVNTLSRVSIAPRHTHLQAIRVFVYLKRFTHGQITVDRTNQSRIRLPAEIDPHSLQEIYPEAI